MRTSLPLVLLLSLLAGCTGDVLSTDREPDSKASALARVTDPVDTGAGGIIRPTRYRRAVPPVRAAELVVDQAARTTLIAPPPNYTNREVVGLVPGTDTCPAANSYWSGGDVFGSSFVPTPNGQRFCAYSWIGASSTPNIDTLPKYCPSGKNCEACPVGWTCEAAPPGYSWLEPTYRGLVPAGLPVEARSLITEKIRAQHWAAMGAPSSMPTASAPSSTWFPYTLPSWFTRVYVFDDSGLHGNTVADWVRQTACPQGTGCPWIERRDVFENGSGAASVLTLARKLVAAVDESGTNPVVINLSLGFHWRHAWNRAVSTDDDVPPSSIRFAHLALQSAINYAGCRGAIVVAAAGNKDGGSAAEESGPRHFGGSAAFPAAFAELDAAWTCTTSPVVEARPLIVPVGAIMADGSISPSARLHGRSCVTAPSLALTPDGDPVEGSSFAAAAVTGVLANLRGYMPGASSSEVIGAFQASMNKIPGSTYASYRVCAGFVDGVYRVNQCKAIKRGLESTCARSQPNGSLATQYQMACGLAASLSCGDIPSISTRLTANSEQEAVLSAVLSDPSRHNARSFQETTSFMPSGATCGVSAVFTDPAARNDRSCPAAEFENGQRTPDHLSTLPGDPGCGCTLVMKADRSLWLMGTLLNPSLTSPSLKVKLSTGSNVVFFGPNSTATDRLYELGAATQETNGAGFAIQLTEALPQGARVEGAEFSFLAGSAQMPQAFSSLVPVLETAP